MRRLATAAALAALVAAAAVGAGQSANGAVPRWKAWICQPADPASKCYVDLSTTTIGADGKRRTAQAQPVRAPIDCFYVYPTVSTQYRGNSGLKVTDEEAHAAVTQAAQFGRVCEVYAPMYRQVTTFGNGNPFNGKYELEYDDVRAAWRDYLAHHNRGRGVVLVGHSEGTYILADLIRKEIEPSPAQRKLLVSAILLGGEVTVANGRATGGSFRRVPACGSAKQTGCVVAYSSWNRTPPRNAAFQSAGKGRRILCVNPGAPGRDGPAPVTPLFPGINPNGLVPAVRSVYTRQVWVAFPHLYTARCVRKGPRAWLLIERIQRPGDRRPTVQPVLSPGWGLHASDVNVALGSLVELVRSQRAAWLAKR